jgi:hypothetical protein
MWLQFDMHSDRDEGYSSFSGSDAEEADGAAPAESFWLPHMASVVDVQSWRDEPNSAGLVEQQTMVYRI